MSGPAFARTVREAVQLIRSATLLSIALASIACSDDTRAVLWPELPPDTLSFLLARGAGSATYGPYASDGPEGGVSLPTAESNELYILTLERSWVASRHPRVDLDALDRMRLVGRPARCMDCNTTCRDERDDVLFHPVGLDSQVRVLDDGAFVPTSLDLEGADLWLEIPGRWECEDATTEDATYVTRWSNAGRHDQILAMDDGEFLLLGQRVRRLGDPNVVDAGSGRFTGAVPWGDRRALVTARRFPLDGTGELLELDLSTRPATLVRTRALPFNPSTIARDERGLVVGGYEGEVATSTDAVNFRVGQIGDFSTLGTLSRISGQSPEYFFGSGRGRVFRGNPWTSTPWEPVAVSTEIDYPIQEIVEVKGEVTPEQPDGRWLWARSSERGSFERPFDGTDWRPTRSEPRQRPSECTQGIDACGFARFPHVTSAPVVREGDVIVVHSTCPRVLVARPEHACVSSFEPRAGFTQEAERGMLRVDGGVYVVVTDGVLFIPLPALD